MSDNLYVLHRSAENFLGLLDDESVALLAIDPPYGNIVGEAWDRKWESAEEYADWFADLLIRYAPKLTPDGSVVFFGAIGSHGHRPLFETMRRLEVPTSPYTYRNLITWKKKRAYGKSHDYLFVREEAAWYSRSPERTKVRFNIPLTNELRGYAGFSKKYPAKSEFKRVGNVWDDIPELFRPERRCQKPIDLMKRIVATHSHPDDLVVDCFAGWGTTGVASVELGRRFIGCEGIEEDTNAADRRVGEAARKTHGENLHARK